MDLLLFFVLLGAVLLVCSRGRREESATGPTTDSSLGNGRPKATVRASVGADGGGVRPPGPILELGENGGLRRAGLDFLAILQSENEHAPNITVFVVMSEDLPAGLCSEPRGGQGPDAEVQIYINALDRDKKTGLPMPAGGTEMEFTLCHELGHILAWGTDLEERTPDDELFAEAVADILLGGYISSTVWGKDPVEVWGKEYFVSTERRYTDDEIRAMARRELEERGDFVYEIDSTFNEGLGDIYRAALLAFRKMIAGKNEKAS